MILPNKYVNLSRSYFGLGSCIIKILSEPKNLDQIWIEFSEMVKNKKYPFPHKYNNLILAINMLYMIGAIEHDKYGRLYICS